MSPDEAGSAAALVPRAASTVALLRPGPDGPAVLLTHRPPSMAFGPGLHVFPGGAVDPGDSDPRVLERSFLAPDACAAAWAGGLEPSVAAAHHVAAIRELYEEAGVLLATRRDGAPVDAAAIASARRRGLPFAVPVEHQDLVLRTDRLVPLSRWVTPPVGVTRRYDTRFFVAEIPAATGAAPARGEVASLEWITPQDALRAMAAGRMMLWTPTSSTLQQLAHARDLEDVRRHLAPIEPAAPPEVDELRPAITRVRLHGAGGVPGQAVNAYVVGRERLVVIDPGDPNDEAVEAILRLVALRGAHIAGILLTSPAPDHAAGAVALALRTGAPVLAGPGAAGLLPDPVEALHDHDVCNLADVVVRVLATPGRQPDHLAFELPEVGAVLVGDLEGGAPSRSIPEPVDEPALRRSLERIAQLGAVARLPAHD